MIMILWLFLLLTALVHLTQIKSMFAVNLLWSQYVYCAPIPYIGYTTQGLSYSSSYSHWKVAMRFCLMSC
uniref:Secreted protein n=1 Tax=Octopus bimaculoides TaxID=37653 RepID=A0A0L8HLX7_OCTBM